MSSSSLRPILDLDIPDLAATDWIEVVRRALKRASEITDQRLNMPEINMNWQLLHRFEYQQFYSAWVGVAFRFRACATHNQDYTQVFQRTRGAAENMNLYLEDDALFSFFIKGLSALESLYYSLYALGAIIDTPTHTPSVPPPDQFLWLDPTKPNKLRKITPEGTRDTFKKVFPGLPITKYLERILDDPNYQTWGSIRNVLAHRVATAGRALQYRGPFLFQRSESPMAVTQWASDLSLDEMTTASRYHWLKETLNSGLKEAATFAVQQLVYTEKQLLRLE